MAICAVCSQNCRGTCAKCGTRLCVQHKPKTARTKCPFCPTTHKSQSVQGNAYYTPSTPQAQAAYNAARPVHSSSSSVSTRPPVRPPSPPPHNFDTMTPQEVQQYLQSLIHRLELKQARELAYLQRRYDRKTYTPTDQAYGEDQVLEDELLEMLRDVLSRALNGG